MRILSIHVLYGNGSSKLCIAQLHRILSNYTEFCVTLCNYTEFCVITQIFV